MMMRKARCVGRVAAAGLVAAACALGAGCESGPIDVREEPAGQVKTIASMVISDNPQEAPREVSATSPAGRDLARWLEANVLPKRPAMVRGPTQAMDTAVADIGIVDAEGHRDQIFVHPTFVDIGGRVDLPAEKMAELRRLIARTTAAAAP